MKLKYYLCGLGSGIILAVLVLMIANKISSMNSGINNSNIPETTGSVIAYTTQSSGEETKVAATQEDRNAQTTVEENTTGKDEKNISDNTKAENVTTEEQKEIVSIHIDAVTIASDVARMLEEKGVIDSAQGFIQYMYDYGYSRLIQQGDFELIKGDTYENVARILTRS